MPALALGTVQFGRNYGVSNQAGQPNMNEVHAILNLARRKGILLLDTASTYGEAEQLIGASPDGHAFKVVGKIHSSINYKQVKQTCEDSLQALRQNCFHALLAHSPDLFLNDKGPYFYEQFYELKLEKKIKKIGVSVYDPEELEQLVESYALDCVQLPLNVFDQRFLPLLKFIKSLGIEIHIRSIFLQGLLLMPLTQLPRYFWPIEKNIQQYYHFIEARSLSPLKAALSFVQQYNEIDYMVCGVNHSTELEEIIETINEAVSIDFQSFAINQTQWISPREWPVLQ